MTWKGDAFAHKWRMMTNHVHCLRARHDFESASSRTCSCTCFYSAALACRRMEGTLEKIMVWFRWAWSPWRIGSEASSLLAMPISMQGADLNVIAQEHICTQYIPQCGVNKYVEISLVFKDLSYTLCLACISVLHQTFAHAAAGTTRYQMESLQTNLDTTICPRANIWRTESLKRLMASIKIWWPARKPHRRNDEHQRARKCVRTIRRNELGEAWHIASTSSSCKSIGKGFCWHLLCRHPHFAY